VLFLLYAFVITAVVGWSVYYVEGQVVIEELHDVESLLAITIVVLILLFTFVLPEMQGAPMRL